MTGAGRLKTKQFKENYYYHQLDYDNMQTIDSCELNPNHQLHCQTLIVRRKEVR